MIKNYFRNALRRIKKHKLHAAINIFGLSVSLATCIFILMWVLNQTSYDKFHENIKQIFRINLRDATYEQHRNYDVTPPALSREMLNDFPEIEYAVTYENMSDILIKHNSTKLNANISFTDNGFFEIFNFPLIKGDNSIVFETPYSTVMTSEMAEKIFKTEDPIGKTIQINNLQEFTVVGVIQDIPALSTLQFEMITSISHLEELFGNENISSWNQWGYETFILLPDNIDREFFESKIIDYASIKEEFDWKPQLYLQSFKDIHLHNVNGGGQIVYITIFSLIAMFVLIIACINFINLATAQATLRAKEIGLRKIIGASRKKLIIQILTESLLMVLFSILLSLVLIESLYPLFREFTGQSISQEEFFSVNFILVLIGICISVGLLSGLYPAFYLSSINPVDAIKQSPKSTSSILRKILIIFQFSISIFLIIASIVVFKQVHFMSQQELGFDAEHILYIPLNRDIQKKYESLKNTLLKNPKILNTTLTSNKIGLKSSGSFDINEWEGNAGDHQFLINILSVNYDFLETFGVDMIEGHFFSETATSEDAGVVFNETAIKAMGLTDPVGSRALDNSPIIGVIKDFNFTSLRTEIKPLIFFYRPDWLSYLAIKLHGQELPETIKFIENKFNEFSPDFQFEYQFSDDAFDQIYNSEQRMGVMFGIFSFVAIVISCLGLFALSLFMVQRRLKEICIRKILGSSVNNIIILLSTAFMKWIFVAFLIAAPTAYFVLNKWLINYAYRITIDIWTFILSGSIVILIAVITVSLQSIKAANTNPVNALKYE